jgi:hypothetical protein
MWDYIFEGNASARETYISYLPRRSVGGPALINTWRGVGYSLRFPPGLPQALAPRGSSADLYAGAPAAGS